MSALKPRTAAAKALWSIRHSSSSNSPALRRTLISAGTFSSFTVRREARTARRQRCTPISKSSFPLLNVLEGKTMKLSFTILATALVLGTAATAQTTTTTQTPPTTPTEPTTTQTTTTQTQPATTTEPATTTTTQTTTTDAGQLIAAT